MDFFAAEEEPAGVTVERKTFEPERHGLRGVAGGHISPPCQARRVNRAYTPAQTLGLTEAARRCVTA